METLEKVTTRSRVSIYRTNDPMETIAAIGLKLDQDDPYMEKNTLCPVTVLADSQVSDRCPWATCFYLTFFKFSQSMRPIRLLYGSLQMPRVMADSLQKTLSTKPKLLTSTELFHLSLYFL